MKRCIPLLLLPLLSLLWSCSGKPSPAHNPNDTPENHEAGIVVTPIIRNTVKIEKPEQSLMPLLSPFSTEGMLILNQYRTHNPRLDEFLQRNRKPDYFFSGGNTGYQYQKIYLVYLRNENLYLFDASLTDPYRKFHPLPASIRDRVSALKPALPPPQSSLPAPQDNRTAPEAIPVTARGAPSPSGSLPTASQQTPEAAHYDIEKNLGQSRPGPMVDIPLLYSLSRGESPANLEQETYYFDKPLVDMLDNEYSIKFDPRKRSVKVIFPQAYDGSALYARKDMETRKILVNRDAASGKEWAILVPDFLPGSPFYQSTRGNVSKAFSSLYQVNLPPRVADASKLRVRYELKLCQRDERENCAHRNGGITTVRAIVLGATLYDGATLTPVETFLLK